MHVLPHPSNAPHTITVRRLAPHPAVASLTALAPLLTPAPAPGPPGRRRFTCLRHRYRPHRPARRRPRPLPLDHAHPHHRRPPRAGPITAEICRDPIIAAPSTATPAATSHTLHNRRSALTVKPGPSEAARPPCPPLSRPTRYPRSPTMFASSIPKPAPPDPRRRPSHAQAPHRRRSPGFTLCHA